MLCYLKKIDLRVIKTHKIIRQTFIELLDKYQFEQISVQKILDNALINRNTFYKYYSGKSELVGAMIADFKAEYHQLMEKRFKNGITLPQIMEISHQMFERRKLLLALGKIKTKRHNLRNDIFSIIKNIL